MLEHQWVVNELLEVQCIVHGCCIYQSFVGLPHGQIVKESMKFSGVQSHPKTGVICAFKFYLANCLGNITVLESSFEILWIQDLLKVVTCHMNLGPSDQEDKVVFPEKVKERYRFS